MDALKKLECLLEQKVEEIVARGDITPSELESMDKVVDILKDLGEIKEKKTMMEEDGYSNRRMSMRYGDGSYSRGRDSMGRYTSNRSYNRGGYSGHGSSDQMINKLEAMMDEASTEKERMAIQNWIDELEG